MSFATNARAAAAVQPLVVARARNGSAGALRTASNIVRLSIGNSGRGTGQLTESDRARSLASIKLSAGSTSRRTDSVLFD
jgi:hypothetical protein